MSRRDFICLAPKEKNSNFFQNNIRLAIFFFKEEFHSVCVCGLVRRSGLSDWFKRSNRGKVEKIKILQVNGGGGSSAFKKRNKRRRVTTTTRKERKKSNSLLSPPTFIQRLLSLGRNKKNFLKNSLKKNIPPLVSPPLDCCWKPPPTDRPPHKKTQRGSKVGHTPDVLEKINLKQKIIKTKKYYYHPFPFFLG